jgi:two-component system chemotaxis sensor kinase CheA
VSGPSPSVSLDYAAILEVFLDESGESLGAMEEAVLALEARPDDAAQVQTLFRHFHTLKGNASSLGLGDLAAFAHTLEDVLDRLRADKLTASDELVTLLLESLDVLREMLDAAAESAR